MTFDNIDFNVHDFGSSCFIWRAYSHHIELLNPIYTVGWSGLAGLLVFSGFGVYASFFSEVLGAREGIPA